MQSRNPHFQSHSYFLPIDKIKGIKFTYREIDILTYLLSRVTAKKIASFLFISPKTVENHIHNIMQKLNCSSRESIIDFLESSDEILILKKYYLFLSLRNAFEQKLREISAAIGKKPLAGVMVYSAEESQHASFVHQFERDLKLAGISVTIEERNRSLSLNYINKEIEQSVEDFRIYLLPKTLKKEILDLDNYKKLSKKEKTNSNNIFFFIYEKESKKKILKTFSEKYVSPEGSGSYFYFFFEVLNVLSTILKLDEILNKFQKEIEIKSLLVPFNFTSNSIREDNNKLPYFYALQEYILKKRKFIITVSLIFVAFSSAGALFLRTNHGESKEKAYPQIFSDLIIPTKSVFLDRPNLMAQINEKLKENTSIQTIALVGPGGAGKTTLARQHSHEQGADLIWELNAETKESLHTSFEHLAQALAKVEEDKKILRGIQDIKNPHEKKERIIVFVKERLKFYPKWILIFDNVDEFSILQGCFPHDTKIWGQGNIIITTRDANIQNNKYINHIININELTSDEKLNFFTKIMAQGNKYFSETVPLEETKKFLNNIPSFPLDVSIAAYYIKTTNTSYKKYLEYLANATKDFEDVQKNLLKESGDYTKTRYSIISLSLHQLINAHKDFPGLLLYVSLLDSQNIPKELLDKYKGSAIVDSFICYLKKYSLITNESFNYNESGAVFSIHRSTQEISLAHLKRVLNLEKSNQHFKPIVNALGIYLTALMEEENLSNIKKLASHTEAFLSHNDLLTDTLRAFLAGELGAIYFFLKIT